MPYLFFSLQHASKPHSGTSITDSRRKPLPGSRVFKKLLEEIKEKKMYRLSENKDFMHYSFRKDILELISERLSAVFPEVSKSKIEKDLKELLQKHGVKHPGENGLMLLLVTLQEVKNLINFISPASMEKVRELIARKGEIMKEISKYIKIDTSLKKELDDLFERIKSLVERLERSTTSSITEEKGSSGNSHEATQHLNGNSEGSISRNSSASTDGMSDKESIVVEQRGEEVKIPKDSLSEKGSSKLVRLVEEVVKDGVKGSNMVKVQLKKEVAESNIKAAKSTPSDVGAILKSDSTRILYATVTKGIHHEKIDEKILQKEIKENVKISDNTKKELLTKLVETYEKGEERFKTDSEGNMRILLSKTEKNRVSAGFSGMPHEQIILPDKVSDNLQNFTMRRVYPEVVVRQIVDRMDIALANGQKELVMELYPPHLGKLRIQLMIHGDSISANFWTPFNDVKAIIEAGLGHLQQHFQEQGMNTGEFGVYVGGGGAGPESEYSEHQLAYSGVHNSGNVEAEHGQISLESPDGHMINILG